MRIWVVLVAIFVVEVSSDAFFLRNNQEAVKRDASYSAQPQYSAGPAIEIEDGYGSPAAPLITSESYSSPVVVTTKVKKSIPLKTSYSASPIEIDDGYGSPAAPVLSAEYSEPEGYSSPVKVKKSIPLATKNKVEIDLDDGYGSPAAPVISFSSAPSVKPVYYRRPPRHNQVKKYRRPKKMFSFLDYMPMMNFLMMGTQRKPKRHIMNYQAQKARHVRKPAPFQMPKFKMPKFRMPKLIPTPIKYPASFAISTKKPIVTKTVQTNFYSPSKKPKQPKLNYSGWQPIGFNYHSPNAPVEANVEPEIITINNAYRHPKKYEIPALPTGTYAPEPITAKPVSEVEEPAAEETSKIVYGVPEIAIEQPKTTYYIPEVPVKVKKSIPQSVLQQNHVESATYSNAYTIKELPRATYPSEKPPAPIEEPIFNSAPVQDLTSLAEVEEYEIHTTTSSPKSISSVPEHVYYRDHQGYGILYQATHDSNHLAEEVQSGSVYVQQTPEPEITPESEDDEDLYYIFYDKNKPRKVKTTSSPGSASTASFNVFVNGQSHGFSHNLEHIG